MKNKANSVGDNDVEDIKFISKQIKKRRRMKK